ncbi:MAG: magnesium transporter [Planctomycetes bacterium]|nr:magnesium transporter [Planctomycetota bacterium]
MNEMTRLIFPEAREIIRSGNVADLGVLMGVLLPPDVADLMAELAPDESAAMFKALDNKQRAEVFEQIDYEHQQALLDRLGPQVIAGVLDSMSSDDRADFVRRLDARSRETLLPLLAHAERHDLKRLLAFAEGTAGSVMSTEYATVEPEMTALQAIEHLRHVAPLQETIYIVYVVDKERHVVGVVSLRQLIVAAPAATVSKLMRREIISVKGDAPREEAANLIAKYDFLALPVVDETGRMIGIITQDDVIDIIKAKATQDAQKAGGMEALELSYFDTSLPAMLRKRGGWLIVLFIGQTFTATAMESFEGAIQKAAVLSLFVPLVISSGGNTGSQAASLIIRSLAVGEVKLADWWRVARREVASGLALGVGLGLLGFLRIVLWPNAGAEYGEHYVRLGLMMWLALMGIVLWGTLAGSLMPLLMKRIGLDPATASTPFVATLVDVTGILIYFSVATLMLSGTLL